MKPIYILSGCLLSTLAAANLHKKTDDFTTWLDKQHDISIHKMLANIGPDGEKAQGVPAGTVLASPSRIYYYQWVRDAALVMEQVVRAYARSGGKDKKLERLFMDYIEVQGKIQKVNNPSGGFRSGGLGEPKFQVNGSAYLG
jgi:glucoamylase